ncbi:hypothetical protein JOB18_003235 [Solea senegalensis]|uniref:Uncharacterized protein n=1 Tax=Solea senegalensis TaxID=28829 RepID=A0AAV6QY40_SOLSE|nr:hypothetical protein JOB18_003235 [Solea senegalensis]
MEDRRERERHMDTYVFHMERVEPPRASALPQETRRRKTTPSSAAAHRSTAHCAHDNKVNVAAKTEQNATVAATCIAVS